MLTQQEFRPTTTSISLLVDDGAVPVTLDFYERALRLTRRFYDPDYQFGELAGRGTVTLAGAKVLAEPYVMP